MAERYSDFFSISKFLWWEYKKFKMGVSRFVSADSFVCRYTWLTKLVRGLSEDSNFLSEQYDAMVKLV